MNRCRFRMCRRTALPQTNSTHRLFDASMDRSEEDGMAYEWSEQRAKRDRLWKVTTMLVATLLTAGIPTMIVLAAMAYR